MPLQKSVPFTLCRYLHRLAHIVQLVGSTSEIVLYSTKAEAKKKMTVRLWAGFVLSIFGMVLSSWSTSFTAMALPLKVTFNLTQSQVEKVSAMSNIGVALCILEPLISGRFGYSTSYTLAWIISPISSMLSFIAIRHKAVLGQCVWLLGGIQLLSSVSTVFMYILLISIGINNFAKEHTGKLIGIYTGIGSLGKLFYAGSIELMFEDDLEGYFLSVSIFWALVFGACVLFHRKRDIKDSALVADDELKESLDNTESVDVEDNESVPVRDMFRSPHFHLICWSYVSMDGCMIAFMDNVTSFGDSTGMKKTEHLVYILSISTFVCRVSSGALLDKIETLTGRFALVILCHLSLISAMIIVLIRFSEVALYFVTVLVGVACSASYSLPLTLLINRFGRANYSIIFGLLNMFATLMVICYQSAIGFFYDMEASQQKSGHFCKGKSCFHLTFVIFLISGVFATVLHVINFLLDRRKKKLNKVCE